MSTVTAPALATPHAAGSASALLGTTQFLMGALAPALTGLGGQATALPLAASVLGLALAAAGCFLVLCRNWRSAPDPGPVNQGDIRTGGTESGPRCRTRLEGR
ncbi:hypothetical protein JHN63_08835 [Streptomyces sp. MBT65]|uniref:hypothetical protein n=1 Tax=Streptomyces sp. MBT65 TaxID=1488395 RepID=UPI00190D75CD|nr:hypothetical protein [Streptomyces sp. MBT65]MBK3573923.1 hypothetical protein [Streptomyces sp. MBT65]